jgi:hypothetical protein
VKPRPPRRFRGELGKFVHRRRATLAATAFASSLVLSGASARAAAPAVALSITPCDAAGVAADRLSELISTEIAASGTLLTEDPTPDALRATIVLCHGSAERVWMSLDQRAQRLHERDVDLSDVEGELRARTIAVAFAEMLSALRASASRRPAPSPAPKPSAAGVRDPQPAHAAAPPSPELVGDRRSDVRRAAGPSRYCVAAGFHLREYVQPATLLIGPWLSIGVGRWRAEALYLQANANVPLGTVRLRSALLSASYTAWELGRALRVGLGARGELGMTWAAGSPRDDDRALGATRRSVQAALMAESRLEIPWTAAIALQARFATGISYGPTGVAGGMAAARSGGVFVATTLGMRLRL